tara:strand:+ start:8042 stop:10642 length:2601 start_codon:yes stop_codon:yes gene_type:complete
MVLQAQGLKPIIIEPVIKKTKVKSSGKLAAVGSLIWSENFESSGNGFPHNGIVTTSKDTVDKGFQRGDVSNSNLGQVFKVPVRSRFAFTNDDYCNCNKSEDELILPSISFNGSNGAVLRFSAYFNRVIKTETAKVFVESGSNWIQVAEIGSYQDWKDYEVLISGAGISNPKIKFVYGDDSTWASGLAIDDIEVYNTVDKLDLRLDSLLINDQIINDFYKIIPKNHASSLLLETTIRASNISKESTTNAVFTSEISGQTTQSIKTNLGKFDSLSSKTDVTFSNLGLANGKGTYTFKSYVSSDSVDNDLTNDTLAFNLELSDTIYSRINQKKANRGFWYGPSKNYDILSLIEITAIDTATSISVYLHDDTQVGDTIDVVIFSEFLQDKVKDTFPQINENIRLQKEHIGDWVTFKIPRSVLVPGKYFVGIKARGKQVVLGVSDNPVKEKLVYANAGSGFGPVDYLPFVKLNIKGSPCGQVQLNASVTKSTCNVKNGQILLNPTGGTAPYRYQWGPNASYSRLSAINGVGSGTYSVTVTDTLGCNRSQVLTLADTSSLAVNLDSIKHEQCFGDSSGYLKIGVTNGIAPYQVLWADGNSDTIRQKLVTGNYTVTVTDASGNGCKSIFNYQISGPYEALSMSSTVENNLCFADQNGSIHAQVRGGYGTIKYKWSDNSLNGPFVESLKTGTYHLTVSDSNNCLLTDSFVVKGADSLGVSGVVTDTGGTASIKVTAFGGNPSYTYHWKGPDGFTDPGTKDLDDLLERGIYRLTVTDSLGCEVRDTFLVAGNVSIHEVQSGNNFIVFPNPSNGQIQIDGKYEKQIEVMIFDQSGREVKRIDEYQGQVIHLSEGLYFFKLHSLDDSIESHTVLVVE